MRLRGAIECRRSGARDVTFVGRTELGGRAHLTLAAPAPADLPAGIRQGTVDLLDGERCRVSMPGREWIIPAPRAFVHHDASAELYAALPPRRVPVAKRLFWRLVLAAARSRTGQRWLAR